MVMGGELRVMVLFVNCKCLWRDGESCDVREI